MNDKNNCDEKVQISITTEFQIFVNETLKQPTAYNCTFHTKKLKQLIVKLSNS